MAEQEDIGDQIQNSGEDVVDEFTSALLFDFIDKNGDGKISKAELIKYANLHNYNPTDEDLEMFKQERFNSDDEEFLDKEEFKKVGDEFLTKLGDPKEILDNALGELDKNSDGRLDINELSELLGTKGSSPLSINDIHELIDACRSRDDEGDTEEDRPYITREALLAVLLES